VAGAQSHVLGEGHESPARLDEIVLGHLSDFDRMALPLDREREVLDTVLALATYGRRSKNRPGSAPPSLCDSRTLVGAVRLIKDQEEIQLMREAAKKSSRVHGELLLLQTAGRTEREIANWIDAGFLKEGMRWNAYETIVGSGERTQEIHAWASDKIVKADDLIMVDAGGEWRGYCADITRTFPSGPKFTNEQKKVYAAVLSAQKSVIASVRPGRSLQDLHQVGQAILMEELEKLGWPQVDVEKLMPHGTSHWIGLDVHDPAPYFDEQGQAITLKSGMCFTVEPALYCTKDSGAPAAFHGIGVRIEDDILVTKDGAEILTQVPKESEEIENLRAKAKNGWAA
jgi:Xaa-Pro aminopeptidase